MRIEVGGGALEGLLAGVGGKWQAVGVAEFEVSTVDVEFERHIARNGDAVGVDGDGVVHGGRRLRPGFRMRGVIQAVGGPDTEGDGGVAAIFGGQRHGITGVAQTDGDDRGFFQVNRECGDDLG